MKKVVAFLFIITSLFTYAQDSTQTKSKKPKRVFIGVNFSSDMCSAVFKNPILDNLGLKAIPKFGFSSGLNICYVIKKYLSLNLGVQYSRKEYEAKSNLTFGDMIDRRRGFVYNSNESYSGTNIYQYIDIPLTANFIFSKKKMRFITSVGLTTNILLNQPNNSFITGNNYSRINLSPTLSCGIDYKINNKMFFRIEPTFRYGLLKVSTGLATQYIWSAGVNFSFYF
jgi:hypothetical protein